MFKIGYDKKITMVQGDTGVIRMRISNYELSQGDEVRFAIVNKANPSILLCQHSDKKIVLEKQVTVFEKDGSARIVIYPYDTEYLQPGKYLYEIQVVTKDGRTDTVVPLTALTLMDGSIQGEFGQTTPSKPEPTPSEIELRFKRLENEIIPELGNRITNVEKEIDSMESKTCSQLGMVIDDIGNSEENFRKLISALSENYKIIVDGDYYIGGSALTLDNVFIDGHGELIFTNHNTVITVRNKIEVKNVTINGHIETRHDSNTLFIGVSGINEILFDNVKSDIYIPLFSFNNRETKKISLKKLAVKNCSFENPQMLFYLYNLKLNEIDIINNYIHNNQTVPFNFNTIDCATIKIDGNKCISDLDYWTPIQTTYLAMVVLKGNGNCYYKNNEVSGLKTRQQGMAVYDSYLSYGKVYWTNNIWCDNVSVIENANGNTLFYGKTEYDETRECVRYVVSNSYRVSDEFISTLTDEEKSNVELVVYRFQVPVDSFIFKNNTIDVGELALKGNDGDQYFKEFVFENCNIKGNLKSDLFRINGKDLKSNFTISNNSITSIGDNSVYLLYSVGVATESDMMGKVTISNNHFDFNFINFIYQVAINELEFYNNNIINRNITITEGAITRNCIINNINGSNNVIKGNYAISDFGANTTSKNISFDISKISKLTTKKTSTLYLPSNCKGYVKIESIKTSGKDDVEFNFIVNGDSVTYSKDGVSITETLDGSKYPITGKSYVYISKNKSINFIFDSDVLYRQKVIYLIE